MELVNESTRMTSRDWVSPLLIKPSAGLRSERKVVGVGSDACTTQTFRRQRHRYLRKEFIYCVLFLSLARYGSAVPERLRTMMESPAAMVPSVFTSERKFVPSAS